MERLENIALFVLSNGGIFLFAVLFRGCQKLGGSRQLYLLDANFLRGFDPFKKGFPFLSMVT